MCGYIHNSIVIIYTYIYIYTHRIQAQCLNLQPISSIILGNLWGSTLVRFGSMAMLNNQMVIMLTIMLIFQYYIHICDLGVNNINI